jgi:hypothetical protein
MDTMHAAHFYKASAYFQLGKFPEEEKAGYDAAELLRKEVRPPSFVLVASELMGAGLDRRSQGGREAYHSAQGSRQGR